MTTVCLDIYNAASLEGAMTPEEWLALQIELREKRAAGARPCPPARAAAGRAAKFQRVLLEVPKGPTRSSKRVLLEVQKGTTRSSKGSY